MGGTVRLTFADGRYHVYAGAGHEFNCVGRSSFNATAARLAFERSLGFVSGRLGH